MSLTDFETILEALKNISGAMTSNGQDLSGRIQTILEKACLETAVGFPFSQRWLETWAVIRHETDEAVKASNQKLSETKHRILRDGLQGKCMAFDRSNSASVVSR